MYDEVGMRLRQRKRLAETPLSVSALFLLLQSTSRHVAFNYRALIDIRILNVIFICSPILARVLDSLRTLWDQPGFPSFKLPPFTELISNSTVMQTDSRITQYSLKSSLYSVSEVRTEARQLVELLKVVLGTPAFKAPQTNFSTSCFKGQKKVSWRLLRVRCNCIYRSYI
jgi:hypothetical protein